MNTELNALLEALRVTVKAYNKMASPETTRLILKYAQKIQKLIKANPIQYI